MLDREDEAIKAFQKSLQLRENWVLPMISLAQIHTSSGDYAEAEILLKRVIASEENNSAAYLALAEVYLKNKADSQTLNSLLVKLQTFADPDASIWTAKGALQRALGNSQTAKESITRALTLDEKNTFALSEMVELLLAQQKYDEAAASAKRLTELQPKSISAKLLLARTLAEGGKTAEALTLLDNLDRNKSEVIDLRKQIIASGSNDIDLLEKQFAAEPQNTVVLGRLCLLTRTQPEKALRYCRLAAEAEPNNLGHAIGFGAALVQAKQFPAAVELFKKLLPYEPENFAVHSNLAAALFELKEFSEAKTEFQWLINKNPGLAVAYYFLAIAHDNLAEYKDALTNYQKFLQIADQKKNQLEIDKVNFRLPILEKQIKQGAGSKRRKNDD